MKSSLSLIISREFFQRVSRKSFIITTILMPILMIGLMAAPALIMMVSTPSQKEIAVIDFSGMIAPTLQNSQSVHITAYAPGTSTDTLEANKNIFGVLVIGEDIIKNPSSISLRTHEAASIELESNLSQQISSTIEDIRLRELGYDNIRQILDDTKANVVITTERIGQEKSTSSMVSFFIGIAMTFILYMFLLIYGQMVMTSIIEEKNNRVLEIVVSSVSPTKLMLGKILGIGLVATVQILIWGVLICSVSAWLMPSLTSMVTGNDIELMSVLSQLGDTGYIISLFAYLLLFLIGGFLFYSAIFAAIGSAVDNIQDAGQLQSIVIIPIMLGLIMAMSVANDPNSTLAFWLSVIPFTSPMVMLARIPFGISTGEIILALVVLYVSTMLVVWLAAKIYRVGIFMYGKKPNLRELIRWATYK
ncbi:MAG TPA: ABC transporter permease [Muribaculaceae bacterium]|nr:ABC transporter permease [Muribaculaceae bacterium]